MDAAKAKEEEAETSIELEKEKTRSRKKKAELWTRSISESYGMRSCSWDDEKSDFPCLTPPAVSSRKGMGRRHTFAEEGEIRNANKKGNGSFGGKSGQFSNLELFSKSEQFSKLPSGGNFSKLLFRDSEGSESMRVFGERSHSWDAELGSSANSCTFPSLTPPVVSSRKSLSRRHTFTEDKTDEAETEDLGGKPRREYSKLPSFLARMEVDGIEKSEDITEEPESKLHDEARITNWSSVLRLCKTSPHLAKYAGPDRWTALHHACNRRPPAEVVEALLLAHPDALLEQDQKGWTPLHHACRFKARPEVVRLLLYLYPSLGKLAASRRGNRGRTPLYYAIRYDAPEGVVEMLLDADPTAVLEKDRAGESPLTLIWDTYALSCSGRKALQSLKASNQHSQPPKNTNHIQSAKLRHRFEKVDLLLRSAFHTKPHDPDWCILHAVCSITCHPTLFTLCNSLYPQQITQIHSITGRTALHCAASSQAPPDISNHIISHLITIFPDAAKLPDKTHKQLPLHLAADNPNKSHFEHDALDLIYQAYPHAVQTPDKYGRLPLHLATANISNSNNPCTHTIHHHTDTHHDTTNNSIVINLLKPYPKAAQTPDITGKLPLHILAQHAESWNADATAILDAYPPAIQTPITAPGPLQGCLPAHLAAFSPDAKPSLIDTLIHHYPAALHTTDAKGRLPIHLACEAGKTWDTGLSSIHSNYPQGLHRRDSIHNWTPLHYAAYSPNSSRVHIETLVGLYREGAEVCDDMHRSPLHLACEAGKGWDNGGLDLLFRAFPEALEMMDMRGWLPLHAAVMNGRLQAKEPERKIAAVKPGAAYHYSVASDDEEGEEVRGIQREEQPQPVPIRSRANMNTGSMDDLAKIDTIYHLLLKAPYTLNQKNIH